MDAIFCWAAEVVKNTQNAHRTQNEGGDRGTRNTNTHTTEEEEQTYIVHTDTQRRGRKEGTSSVAGFHIQQAANKQLQDEYSSVLQRIALASWAVHYCAFPLQANYTLPGNAGASLKIEILQMQPKI